MLESMELSSMVLDGRFVEVNCSVFKPNEEEIKLYTFSLIIISFQQVRIADQARNFSRGLFSHFLFVVGSRSI